MKLKLFAAPFALLLVCQWASVATAAEPDSANVKDGASSPTIRFMRPLKDERFFDYPIFVQVDVKGFQLVAPGEHRPGRPRPNVGHILYSFDDYPVVSTDDTQFMIGKKIGENYLPVGLHVLKAQLVDENDHPLTPPTFAVTEVFTGHPAVVEAIHTENGSEKAELTGQELYQMRVSLEQVQKELHKLQVGNPGFTPSPVSGGGHE